MGCFDDEDALFVVGRPVALRSVLTHPAPWTGCARCVGHGRVPVEHPDPLSGYTLIGIEIELAAQAREVRRLKAAQRGLWPGVPGMHVFTTDDMLALEVTCGACEGPGGRLAPLPAMAAGLVGLYDALPLPTLRQHWGTWRSQARGFEFGAPALWRGMVHGDLNGVDEFIATFREAMRPVVVYHSLRQPFEPLASGLLNAVKRATSWVATERRAPTWRRDSADEREARWCASTCTKSRPGCVPVCVSRRSRPWVDSSPGARTDASARAR